ncbi:MAG: hypothetical protein ACR2IE_02125 [Candidatus Sumerlaeaceae bacterium]
MLWIALLALVHLGAACVLTDRFWKPARRADYPTTVLLTAFTTFYGLPVILGYTTSFINTWTVVGSAALAVGMAALCSRRFTPGDVTFRNTVTTLRQMSRSEIAAWGCVAAVLVIALLVGATLPIRIWDAASYHSLAPMRWAQSHRFQLDSFGDPTLYPYLGAGEVYANLKAMLPFLILDWTGKLDGTALAQWPFFAAIPVLLLGIFRRAGLPRWTVPLGALFCMLAPEVLLQSIEAYADIVFFTAQLMVVWACLVTWSEGPSLRTMLLTSLAFAQLAASKPTGLTGSVALGIAYLTVVIMRTQGGPSHRLRRTGIALILVVAACALIAGPWYMHGLLKLNNPVYPIEVAAGQKVIFPGPYKPDFNTQYTERYAQASGVRAWWRMAMDTWRPSLLASWSGGMGLHSVTLGLPALALFLLLGVRGVAWRERLLILILFAVMLVSCPTRILARFALFELALGALCFCWLLSYVTTLPRRALVTLAAACMGYDLYATIPSIQYRTRPVELIAYNLLSGDRRALRDDSFPDEYSTLDYWREHVAEKKATLAIPGEMAPWFAYAPNTGAGVVRIADSKAGEPSARWLADLTAARATHIYALRKSENFRVAMADPKHFRLLMHRIDSGAESSLWLEPEPEAALFEFVP